MIFLLVLCHSNTMPDNEKASTSKNSTQNSFDFLFLHEWSFVYSVPVEYLVRLKKYVVLHSMTVLASPQCFFMYHSTTWYVSFQHKTVSVSGSRKRRILKYKSHKNLLSIIVSVYFAELSTYHQISTLHCIPSFRFR